MADTEKKRLEKADSDSSNHDVSAIHRENASDPSTSKMTQRGRRKMTAADMERAAANAKLANPLSGYGTKELQDMGEAYARDKCGLTDEADIHAFRYGALVAQNPKKFDAIEGLPEADRLAIEEEFTRKWHLPRTMYLVVILCSVAAAVQGMDETVVNGAQLFYLPQFGLDGKDQNTELIQGLVNGAPYLACATIGCWCTPALNKWLGRRNTVFVTCLISAVACFWQGFTNSWPHLFAARFVLGLGIGPKSATVPVFAAECSPPNVRGSLVMQWQMWTAFGIMVGYAVDLAFLNVPDKPHIHGLNWRLMLGSAMFPAVIVCCFVFLCPESPRWYMSKGRHADAYKSMCRLRYRKVQAARDVFYMHVLLEIEQEVQKGKNKIMEFVRVPRNRRAMLASTIVMFMQQFCGVNVIAYYSAEIFTQANFSTQSALAAGLGFGIINFLFAIPAIFTIDTFGRRNLLLTTFPLMGLFLLFTGFSKWIPNANASVGCVALGIYLFGMVYSPGEGPVPFTYSAEAYPLYIRSHGMALATATLWLFNFSKYSIPLRPLIHVANLSFL
jgi:sugar porter (SP) family MFS transporter